MLFEYVDPFSDYLESLPKFSSLDYTELMCINKNDFSQIQSFEAEIKEQL